MKKYQWVCEICGQQFGHEIDLLAHQFCSPCEKEINERHNEEPIVNQLPLIKEAREAGR